MHNPYGRFPADDSRSAAFAVAADMSPWIINGDFISPGQTGQPPQIINLTDSTTRKLGLGQFHKQEGQFVLYADGHNSWETQPNVGVNKDNIYTYWSKDKEPTEQDIQGGTAPTGRTPENDAKSKDDSFLAI